MTQILDRLPANCTSRILCCYTNDAHKIKVARITNISNWYFERVVFPGERLLFEALPEAQLEIYATVFSTVALVETIACDRLAIKDYQTNPTYITRWIENRAGELDESYSVVEEFVDKERVSSQL